MSMQGHLNEVDVPSVIELARQMPSPVGVQLRLPQGEEGTIFVQNGQVVHAVFGPWEGMEALYRLFPIQEGTFELGLGQSAPKRTIQGSWNSVLLDVLRRIDDAQAEAKAEPAPAAHDPAPADVSSPLAKDLEDLLAGSDFQGAAVVGRDGLIYASHIPAHGTDEDLLGAVAASIFALSARSVQQLKRGNLLRTLIQGKQGNIIVTVIDEDTLFVGLASPDLNLGMAFAEARTISSKLAQRLAAR